MTDLKEDDKILKCTQSNLTSNLLYQLLQQRQMILHLLKLHDFPHRLPALVFDDVLQRVQHYSGHTHGYRFAAGHQELPDKQHFCLETIPLCRRKLFP